MKPDRRQFLARLATGCGGAVLCGLGAADLLFMKTEQNRLRVGFAGDPPGRLDEFTREASWYKVAGDRVVCLLCPHRCLLAEGDRGFCRVRAVAGGRLQTLVYGNPCSLHIDPIEKKPLYHFLPGTPIVSLATAGCNMRCLNCQNWTISQSRPEDLAHGRLMPDDLMKAALTRQVPSLAYTYSEPVVFYEYTRDCAALARTRGLRNIMVTAGYISPAPLKELCRVIDAANVDIKSFSEVVYRKLVGARLAPVLRAVEIMREEGVWVEITRLVVPEYSDDLKDIQALSRWMANTLGADVPLHLSRFHPSHRLTGLPATPPDLLDEAARVARTEGLRHVYVGNLPGREVQDTFCPHCRRLLIERRGFLVTANHLHNGQCPCGTAIAGRWA